MDNLDFLDGPTPAEPTAAATTPEEPQAQAPVTDATPPAEAPGQPRDDHGRFAPKALAEAPAAEAAPQTPAIPPEAASQPPTEQAKAPDGFVPVEALTALRREFQAFKQSVQQPPQPPPDPYQDFEAYEAYQSEQRNAERFEWSSQLLAVKYGDETAQKVREWAAEKANTDPLFYQQALSQRDPYGFAMDAWKRDQVLTKLSDPQLLDRFLAFASGQAAPQQATAIPPQAPQQPIAPPPSITSAPNAGGGVQHVPLGQEQVYGSIFG